MTHFLYLFVEGVVWINRFNLGRYWDIGPQQNLFLPSPLLKRGYFFDLDFQVNEYQHYRDKKVSKS
jgi:beta-galactosidase